MSYPPTLPPLGHWVLGAKGTMGTPHCRQCSRPISNRMLYAYFKQSWTSRDGKRYNPNVKRYYHFTCFLSTLPGQSVQSIGGDLSIEGFLQMDAEMKDVALRQLANAHAETAAVSQRKAASAAKKKSAKERSSSRARTPRASSSGRAPPVRRQGSASTGRTPPPEQRPRSAPPERRPRSAVSDSDVPLSRLRHRPPPTSDGHLH